MKRFVFLLAEKLDEERENGHEKDEEDGLYIKGGGGEERDEK